MQRIKEEEKTPKTAHIRMRVPARRITVCNNIIETVWVEVKITGLLSASTLVRVGACFDGQTLSFSFIAVSPRGTVRSHACKWRRWTSTVYEDRPTSLPAADEPEVRGFVKYRSVKLATHDPPWRPGVETLCCDRSKLT